MTWTVGEKVLVKNVNRTEPFHTTVLRVGRKYFYVSMGMYRNVPFDRETGAARDDSGHDHAYKPEEWQRLAETAAADSELRGWGVTLDYRSARKHAVEVRDALIPIFRKP